MNCNSRRTFASPSLIVALATICLLQVTAGNAAPATKHKPKQAPGGANQVQGLNGKIGQPLFDGRWRFEVLSAPKQTDHYVLKNQNAEELPGIATVNWDSIDTPRYYEPRAGYTLYTVDCVLKNGQKSVKQLDCWTGPPHTAITDDQGQSYPPVGYDMATHGSWQSQQLAPGSSEPMTIIFAVPPGTKFKDMVFTLRNNGDNLSHDLRISLGDDTEASASGNASVQPAGGANQVAGLNGKVGDMLFDGRWRFEALSAPKQTDSYAMKVPSAEEDFGKARDVANYDSLSMPRIFTPKPGYTLYTVDCLVKNGQNKVMALDCWTDSKTALTDDQGQSYPAIGYDMMTQGAWTTKPLLPGSAEKMTVIFAVPPGTKLKDMIFTLRNGGDHLTHDLRISMAK